ncbi:unnamed protein product [Prorocentrum cordatum]|uniref:Uncharacterized protein n=1 Tax=Prorocentrum cordatum TaxID=2364126 RepID=A0ABN9S543_9DINO|nr:unnamed protein product [Polarella glacialis]
MSEQQAETRPASQETNSQTLETPGGEDPPYQGPLDCRPDCRNPECEARHLDVVERQRWNPEAGFRYPREPKLVVTASRDMGRTASTWVFNAVRLLFRQAHEACDSYWIRALSPQRLRQRMATGAHVLVKTHEWTDNITEEQFRAVAPLFTHVVVSIRDGFPPDPDWMKVATHVTRFEDIVAHDGGGRSIGALTVLRSLADHLGLEGLSDADLRAVDSELMHLPIPGDQTTKFWSFHARRGGRPQSTAAVAPQ